MPLEVLIVCIWEIETPWESCTSPIQ